MKKFFVLFFCLSFVYLSFNVSADTSNLVNQATSLVEKTGRLVDKLPVVVSNATTAVKTEATNVVHQSDVATNLNQLMLEVLSGARDVGKEVYGASKEALSKSVDFVKEQAPDVVKQFLMWKMAESILWLLVGVVITGFLFYVSYRLMKYANSDDIRHGSDECFLKLWSWVIRVFSLAILLMFIGSNLFDIVKIYVAPKVYIIEYVVDLAKPNHHVQ